MSGSDDGWADIPTLHGPIPAPHDLPALIKEVGTLVGAMLDRDQDDIDRAREMLLDRSTDDIYLAGLHYCRNGFGWRAEIAGSPGESGRLEVAQRLSGPQSNVISPLGPHEQFPGEFAGQAAYFDGVGTVPSWVAQYVAATASTLATIVSVGEALVRDIALAMQPPRELSAIAEAIADRPTVQREQEM